MRNQYIIVSINLFLLQMICLFFFLYEFPHLKGVDVGESVVFIMLLTHPPSRRYICIQLIQHHNESKKDKGNVYVQIFSSLWHIYNNTITSFSYKIWGMDRSSQVWLRMHGVSVSHVHALSNIIGLPALRFEAYNNLRHFVYTTISPSVIITQLNISQKITCSKTFSVLI